jgi:hypothetical protein
MTNQENINEHTLKHTDCLKKVFGYQDVYRIADDILNATAAGKYYATLKFLQQYCTPVNIPQSNVSGFRSGDPRQYKELNYVKNDWEFVVAEGIEVGFSVSKSQKEYEPGISISLKTERSMELTNFPDYYKQYFWNGKHKLFGYPSDSYPNFPWIASLEKRFNWLRDNSVKQKTASQYLIKEMIEWGGSQGGVLQKFNDGIGEVNLLKLVQKIIANLDSSERAIKSSLSLPGLGLTYASKLLRFMKPERYGALDSRIRKALFKRQRLSKIYDGNIDSMVNGYLEFLKLLNTLKSQLLTLQIRKPDCSLSNTCSQ